MLLLTWFLTINGPCRMSRNQGNVQVKLSSLKPEGLSTSLASPKTGRGRIAISVADWQPGASDRSLCGTERRKLGPLCIAATLGGFRALVYLLDAVASGPNAEIAEAVTLNFPEMVV